MANKIMNMHSIVSIGINAKFPTSPFSASKSGSTVALRVCKFVSHAAKFDWFTTEYGSNVVVSPPCIKVLQMSKTVGNRLYRYVKTFDDCRLKI